MRHRSRTSDAIWTAFSEGIRFVVVPLVLVHLVTTNFPDLQTPFMPNIETYIIFFGGMIAVAGTIESANKPGTFKRLLFGLSALAFVCMWLFVVFGGGISNFTYGPYFVEFDMTKIVYIMLVGVSLKGLLVVDVYSKARHQIKEDEKEERLELAEAKAEARAKARAKRKRAAPAMSGMSKVAFEVTPDDDVGYSQPSPEPPTSAAPMRSSTARVKECPVCGERVRSSDTMCKSCGAWLTRGSSR